MIDISNVKLETKNFIIRCFEEKDLKDFYDYASVPGIGENAGWKSHKNIDETRIVLNKFLEEKNVFALYYKKDKKVIGSLGLHKNIDNDIFYEFLNSKIIEVGFVLSKKHWGQGLMLEALKEICKYLFEKEHYEYIVAAYFENNIQSSRLQEKCGFKKYKTGYYKINNKNVKSTFTILKNNGILSNTRDNQNNI